MKNPGGKLNDIFQKPNIFKENKHYNPLLQSSKWPNFPSSKS